jgi:2-keto-4-pentenoate hydratase/2-oxohepta-3-ene-1,7-dioic acid hydratase in catechol pathway
VNGELRQDGSTADLIFDIATIVSYCAAFATLLPGDVILTGTPAGVGPLAAGDDVEIEVEGIGTLTNSVERE